MNAVQRFAKNSLALGLARLFRIVSNLILILFISRFLKADGLGVYATALAFYGTGRHWVDLGMFNFISREVARNPGKTNRYILHLGALSLAVTLPLLSVLVIVVRLLGYSSETTMGIYIMLLALVAAPLNTILEAVTVAYQRVELTTLSQLVGNAGEIVGTISLLAIGYGIIPLILNFVCWRYATFLVMALLFSRHIMVPKWEFSLTHMKILFGEVKYFALLGICGGFFTSEVEIILLSILTNDLAVGLYSASLKIITVWYFIPHTVLPIAFPLLSKSFIESRERFTHLQARTVKYLMLTAFPLTVGLFALSDRIILILYGPGFEAAVPLLQLMAWMPILFFLSDVLWRTLLARNEQQLASRVQIISIIVRLASGAGLILAFGYIGAALALGVTFAIFVSLHMHYAAKGGTPIAFFRLSRSFLISSFIMGIATWTLEHRMAAPLALNVAVSLILYGTLVYLFQGLQREDLDVFRRLVACREKLAA